MNKLLATLCVLLLAVAIIGCSKASAPSTGDNAPAPNAAPAVPNAPAAAPATGAIGGVTADDLNVGEGSDPTAGTTGSTTPDVSS